jgi:cell division septum initiation protein DivIVA
VDIFRLLDKLEELPDQAKHLPLKLMYGFDHEKFYYLVLKIRANLPEDLKKAQKVAMETERIVDEAKDAAEQQKETGRIHANRILEDARREADQILEAARQESARLVSSSEVVRLASAQAREVLNNVETEASEIRKGADDYAADVLTNLEQAVDKTLTGVKKNKAIFQSMKK